MSAVSALAGAAAGQGWKIASGALLALLLAVGGAGGAALWFADRALTKSEAQLADARDRAADYQAAIREQNRATAVLAREKVSAEARGLAAQQQAAADGRRYDAALEKMTGARITTCAEAMPYVNKLLEDVR